MVSSTLIFQTNLQLSLVATAVVTVKWCPAVEDGSPSAGPLQLAPDRFPPARPSELHGLNGFILPHVPA